MKNKIGILENDKYIFPIVNSVNLLVHKFDIVLYIFLTCVFEGYILYATCICYEHFPDSAIVLLRLRLKKYKNEERRKRENSLLKQGRRGGGPASLLFYFLLFTFYLTF